MMPMAMPMKNPRRILSPLLPPSAMSANPLLLLLDVGEDAEVGVDVDVTMLLAMLDMMSVAVGVALETGLGLGRGGPFGRSGLGSRLKRAIMPIYIQLFVSIGPI